MSDRSIRWTEGAEDDLLRLLEFLGRKDAALAERVLTSLRKALELARELPYVARAVDEDDMYLRQLVVRFGKRGYVAAYRISDEAITVIGIRHQREDDFD
jgi:plasmid stabilization system protein ParE